MNVPGFFKVGFYAKAIRAIINEKNFVSLEVVSDSPQDIAVTTTVKELFPTSTGLAYEYEAFGVLDTATVGATQWTLEVLDTAGGVLKTVQVKVSLGLGAHDIIPWYIKGRSPVTVSGPDGFRLRCTEDSGSGTLKILSARLYGMKE